MVQSAAAARPQNHRRLAAVAVAVATSRLLERRFGGRPTKESRRGRANTSRRDPIARHGYRDAASSFGGVKGSLVLESDSTPSNLYELFRLSEDASPAQIKKAYYKMQKICHPDVAGEDGEEMCILLNDAYQVLGDKEEKLKYDERLQFGGNNQIVLAPEGGPEGVDHWDAGKSPMWQTKGRAGTWQRNLEPELNWASMPLSKSYWAKVAGEERGERWYDQLFLFVDEWQCIGCRNCCDIAPQTFTMDPHTSRARVFAQWNHPEDYMEAAKDSCPVECIHWVSREELQSLEYVTASEMWRVGGMLPCSMALRQGIYTGAVFDVFGEANAFQSRNHKDLRDKAKIARTMLGEYEDRISDVLKNMTTGLRSGLNF